MSDLVSTPRPSLDARSRFWGSSARRALVGVAVVVLVMTIVGCAAGDPRFTAEAPAGFWHGLWHGMISWITLVVGIFDASVKVYEIDNGGGWYDFGFLLGATSIWGGGSSAGFHRSRRRRRTSRATE